jgi:hypothetical protein
MTSMSVFGLLYRVKDNCRSFGSVMKVVHSYEWVCIRKDICILLFVL